MKTYVTKPHLPNKKKLFKKINEVYSSRVLTNYGRNVQILEQKLAERFGVKHVIAVANGTLGLQIALKALNLKNEVITSPFSYISTATSIIWQNLKPIYVDIDKNNFNINTKLLVKKITKKISAILPVHVFGNGNDVEFYKKIKKKFGIKVIYDASHCFDIDYKKKSILNYGDCSVVSFHATKIFHTIEGGAIFTNNANLAKNIRRLINFGYENSKIKSIGINAKMNEFEAIMGILMLDEMKYIISSRKLIYDKYYYELKSFYKFQARNSDCSNNYSYFPIVFNSTSKLKKVISSLKKLEIYPRRYFYPSLNTLDFNKIITKCPVSEDLSNKIICLPIYPDLPIKTQNQIIKILKSS